MQSSPWLKNGFLNTLEHGITRFSDAATTFVLLWALPTEVFSKLALAQASVAVALLIFIAPETILYREYANWNAEDPDRLLQRLAAFRLFAWSKGILGLMISTGVSYCFYSGSARFEGFLSLVWAFAIALTPQISGPDREFLRLSLRLKELNFLSLYQKIVFFIGTLVIAFIYSGNIILLTLFAMFMAASTAFLAWRQVKSERGPLLLRWSESVVFLRESFSSFSIWNHLVGVGFGWIQTLDLFMLGLFRFPAYDIGLYAAVLKIANFAITLPMALSNLFSVWIGRRVMDLKERYFVRKLFSWVFAASTAQAIILFFVAPAVLSFLSHGRWSFDDEQRMMNWFFWILSGSVIIGSSYLLSSWLILRQKISQVFIQVYLPLGALTFLIYCLAGWHGDVLWVARANVIVALGYFLLLSKRIFVSVR